MRFPLYFLVILLVNAQNDGRGKCLNVPGNGIRKVGVDQWGTGGNIQLEVNFASLEAQMIARRAGTINDASFFEIQITASHQQAGNVQLFPGKPVTPMDSLSSIGSNKFKVGLINRESKQLSQQGKASLKLNFKYVRSDLLRYFY